MSKTRRNLIDQALRNLGALDETSVPPPDEVTTVDSYVNGMLLGLSARDIVFIEDDEDIPEEWFLPLADCLAWASAAAFGAAGDQALMGLKTQAEDNLRVMARVRPTYKTLGVTTF